MLNIATKYITRFSSALSFLRESAISSGVLLTSSAL